MKNIIFGLKLYFFMFMFLYPCFVIASVLDFIFFFDFQKKGDDYVSFRAGIIHIWEKIKKQK